MFPKIQKVVKSLNKLNNVKIKLIILIITAIILISCITAITFARYAKEVDVNYKTTTGEMICEFELEQDASYVENDVQYFLIKVKNYRQAEDDTITLTDIEETYSLTIQDKNNTGGLYYWTRVDNEDCGTEYSNSITTNTYSFGNLQQEEVTFKVYVKLDNSVTEDKSLDIDVCLNAEQVEKVTSFEREGT